MTDDEKREEIQNNKLNDKSNKQKSQEDYQLMVNKIQKGIFSAFENKFSYLNLFRYNMMIEDVSKLNKISNIDIHEINNKIEKIIPITQYMEKTRILLKDFDEKKKDPYSSWNYHRYEEALKDFYWAIPYKLSKRELLIVLNKVSNESEFDIEMEKLFDDNKIISLFRYLTNNIEGQHKVMLEQIEFAFSNQKYALCNSGLISLIDFSLSYYLKNKEQTKRAGIFEPIIEDLGYKDIEEVDDSVYFTLITLSNNINIIFKSFKFTNDTIPNSKQIRRYPYQHGFKFSNKRIDSLMLINTLYNIIELENNLTEYKNCLIYIKKEGNKKRKFYIDNEEKKGEKVRSSE